MGSRVYRLQYRFDERRVDKGGGYCHYTTNGNHYTAVVLHTDKLPFHSFENSSGDADTFTFTKRNR